MQVGLKALLEKGLSNGVDRFFVLLYIDEKRGTATIKIRILPAMASTRVIEVMQIC
jgi:predicted nucleotide-binding protein (sugar kinase/HSP70/actin superfamily)